MKNNYRIACLGLFLLMAATGCEMPRTYGTMFHRGISPIHPEMGYGFLERYQTIDTLTPELKWRDLKEPNETYDVAVWETPYRSVKDIKKKQDQFASSWGDVVYFTNSLATNSHRVAVPLKPDTYYNWSVRIVSETKTNPWSSFAQQKVILSVIHEHYDVPFAFKTPLK